ncbi:MAG: hypothetical protein KAR05_01880 [Candidatus Omnitrophica bacterium]|nr:hypothetical protein [Candidatus Omnitrophota bacterium]
MKRIIILALLVLWAMGTTPAVYAHCEIPCGIYDDQIRVSLIEEHITTIKKSMRRIQGRTSQEAKNYNQIVRQFRAGEASIVTVKIPVIFSSFPSFLIFCVGDECDSCYSNIVLVSTKPFRTIKEESIHEKPLHENKEWLAVRRDHYSAACRLFLSYLPKAYSRRRGWPAVLFCPILFP